MMDQIQSFANVAGVVDILKSQKSSKLATTEANTVRTTEEKE